MARYLVALISLLFSLNACAQVFSVETAMAELPVHPKGDNNVFATSFDYRDGKIFLVYVAPSNEPENGMNLRTIVRKGVRQTDGSWSWENSVLEPRTLLDPWHTQASIALDKYGYVHVAYNMHNMPWQYAVSKKPYDISAFYFLGQAVTESDLKAVKLENKTPFPHIGSGSIPGNQITYPMFFSDREKNLYVTYRYALKPARSWENRAFAGGIARYDADLRQWSQIGGNFTISYKDAKLMDGKSTSIQKPFAFSPGYSVYLPTLAFDVDNGMHIFWSWRKEGAGMETTHPSYAYSPDRENFFSSDGAQLLLPISVSEIKSFADNDDRQFYAPKTVAVTPNKIPVAVFQPLSGGRELVTIDRTNDSVRIEKTPESAQNILIDSAGRQWLFATGIKVFMRETETAQWRVVGTIGTDLCFPKAKYYSEESRFILQAKSCHSMAMSVFTFRR